MKQAQSEKMWDTYDADGKGEASETEAIWQEHYNSNYLQPSENEIESDPRIATLLQSGDVALVVPMKENGPVVRQLLSRIKHQMPLKRIVIVNDRSDAEAVEEVKNNAVPLVDRDDILDAIDWNRLLPILNLDERPYGKGMSVLAGYLHQYYAARLAGSDRTPAWLAQHDADLSLESKHHNLEYLLWALCHEEHGKKVHHVKVAKYGRGNERVMVMRNSLLELEYLPKHPSNYAISRRAKELFELLSGYKWILSGQFMLSWQAAMNRPFATGYLEETLTAAYAEDLANGQDMYSLQVANPNPCVGGVNGHCKENIILQIASSFVLTLALIAKPVHAWSLKDIGSYNHDFMSRTRPMALIPLDEGPVKALTIPQERLLPSVNTLVNRGFVNEEKAVAVAKKILS